METQPTTSNALRAAAIKPAATSAGSSTGFGLGPGTTQMFSSLLQGMMSANETAPLPALTSRAASDRPRDRDGDRGTSPNSAPLARERQEAATPSKRENDDYETPSTRTASESTALDGKENGLAGPQPDVAVEINLPTTSSETDDGSLAVAAIAQTALSPQTAESVALTEGADVAMTGAPVQATLPAMANPQPLRPVGRASSSEPGLPGADPAGVDGDDPQQPAPLAGLQGIAASPSSAATEPAKAQPAHTLNNASGAPAHETPRPDGALFEKGLTEADSSALDGADPKAKSDTRPLLNSPRPDSFAPAAKIGGANSPTDIAALLATRPTPAVAQANAPTNVAATGVMTRASGEAVGSLQNGVGAVGETRLRGHDVAPQKAPQAPSRPAPAVDQIALQIRRAHADGLDQIRIQLRPEALGRVDVRMEFSKDGQVAVLVSTDRQDTLDLLQRDARGLERALADAGLKTDSGNLQFTLHDHAGQQHNDQTSNGAENALAGMDDSDDTAPAASETAVTWTPQTTVLDIQV